MTEVSDAWWTVTAPRGPGRRRRPRLHTRTQARRDPLSDEERARWVQAVNPFLMNMWPAARRKARPAPKCWRICRRASPPGLPNERCGVHSRAGPCVKAVNLFWSALRVVVMAFALVAGLALLAMVGIICVDIVMRLLGRSFAGTYDVVRFTGTIAIAGALPYTTAVKGHVAVEYFFQKLHRIGRICGHGLPGDYCGVVQHLSAVHTARQLLTGGKGSLSDWATPVLVVHHRRSMHAHHACGSVQSVSPRPEMIKP